MGEVTKHIYGLVAGVMVFRPIEIVDSLRCVALAALDARGCLLVVYKPAAGTK